MSSIENDYEVLELIGRGSFGNVRKVRRISDGKIMVRKEINYLSMNPKQRSQLNAEFSILRELKHPNIVQYYHHELIQNDHTVHLYMEYCEGGDLAGVIKECKKTGTYVPEELVWRVFTQTLLALHKCHYGVDAASVDNLFQIGELTNEEPIGYNSSMTVIHRDIKPDNVFLLKNNYVKLGDFGLAKVLESENDFATTYVGTPYYMSPEVLMDEPYTPLSDIWSLGCVMYELCALHPPFLAKTHLQLSNRIKQGTYDPIPNHYSQMLRMTIDACITIDPSHRPSSASLLQSNPMKMVRMDMRLMEKEQYLIELEDRLRMEDAGIREREATVNAHLNELEAREMALNKKFEEISSVYESEYQYLVEQEVQNRLRVILQQQDLEQSEHHFSNSVHTENTSLQVVDSTEDYEQRQKDPIALTPYVNKRLGGRFPGPNSPCDISMSMTPSPKLLRGPRINPELKTPSTDLRTPLRVIPSDISSLNSIKGRTCFGITTVHDPLDGNEISISNTDLGTYITASTPMKNPASPSKSISRRVKNYSKSQDQVRTQSSLSSYNEVKTPRMNTESKRFHSNTDIMSSPGFGYGLGAAAAKAKILQRSTNSPVTPMLKSLQPREALVSDSTNMRGPVEYSENQTQRPFLPDWQPSYN